jgi:hypothetical protein
LDSTQTVVAVAVPDKELRVELKGAEGGDTQLMVLFDLVLYGL